MLALLEHTNCGSKPASALAISNETNSVSIDVQLAIRIPGSSSREQRRDQRHASLLQTRTPKRKHLVNSMLFIGASQWQEGEQA
jgi:hypothetical protein